MVPPFLSPFDPMPLQLQPCASFSFGRFLYCVLSYLSCHKNYRIRSINNIFIRQRLLHSIYTQIFANKVKLLPLFIGSKVCGSICREILEQYRREILLQNPREILLQYLCGVDREFCGLKTCSARWEHSPHSLRGWAIKIFQ